MSSAVDWDEYKRRCGEPAAFSRWMLEQTVELLEQAEAAGLASKLRRGLDAAPLPKPADHKAGPATDMFILDLAVADACAVMGWMRHALERDWTTTGTRSRGLGGFVEAWTEYVTWKANMSPGRSTSDGGE